MTRWGSLVVFVAACAGAAADRPLTVGLGIPREQARREIHAHAFCPAPAAAPQKLEVYPRCERVGAEWGEAWVTARYDGDSLVELRRFERYADDEIAVQRWNQLVGARAGLSPETPDAFAALRARGPLEPGTRSVKVFRIDPSTIAAVYLLTPTPPHDASVLEAIIHTGDEPARE